MSAPPNNGSWPLFDEVATMPPDKLADLLRPNLDALFGGSRQLTLTVPMTSAAMKQAAERLNGAAEHLAAFEAMLKTMPLSPAARAWADDNFNPARVKVVATPSAPLTPAQPAAQGPTGPKKRKRKYRFPQNLKDMPQDLVPKLAPAARRVLAAATDEMACGAIRKEMAVLLGIKTTELPSTIVSHVLRDLAIKGQVVGRPGPNTVGRTHNYLYRTAQARPDTLPMTPPPTSV